MNPELQQLHAYPFERLAKLKQGITTPANLTPIALSIGEPKHAAPAVVLQTLAAQLDKLAQYPLTRGTAELRQAICDWLIRRFKLAPASINAEQHILPVNGTREALFAIAQTVIDRSSHPLVMMPNPFYQIYEGACLLAGAEPYYMNCEAQNGFIPDFAAVPASVWQRCQLIYICSPGNPTGAIIAQQQLNLLMELAQKYNFVIVADECYSEIYPDENQPPLGLLEAAQQYGNSEFKHCVVFHSLSKRSNLPGLRSGFIAGDAAIIEQFHRYRTYHGCAMPPPSQLASISAWQDETHVIENRQRYREKFAAVMQIVGDDLQLSLPQAGFYLWPRTPIDDEKFTQGLFAAQNVTVLPGQYLSRQAHGINPGAQHVRMALVADLEQCIEAAKRIKDYLDSLH